MGNLFVINEKTSINDIIIYLISQKIKLDKTNNYIIHAWNN